MKNLKQAWYIALKDLKIFVQDRAALFFSIIFPFLFIILFNSLFSGVGWEDDRITLHVTTQEPEGGISYQIIAAIETKDEEALSPGDPIIIWDKDYEADHQAVLDGKLDGFLNFPASFTQSLMSGASTGLEIYADAGATNTRAALQGLSGAITSQINADVAIIKASAQLLAQSGASPEEIQTAVQQIQTDLFSGAAAAKSYLSFEVVKVGNVEAQNASNWVIPGYLVMFVFMAAATSAPEIVKERKNNTLERLFSTSVKRESILGGIYSGIAFKGLIQIIIFWVFGILVFHVNVGLSPLAIIILSLLMVIMSSAFAIMLATLANSIRGASSLAVITSLLLAPLGGCWWPGFLYPEWLQNISKITPHAWATDAFNKLMVFGADFGDVVPSIIALLVFAVIFSGIAVWKFRISDR
ncbi:MAG: ABC transporter permease [Dehalococcoidales bacterium]|nr:ABC transporter permease [Dehalococcoidales bacterium]